MADEYTLKVYTSYVKNNKKTAYQFTVDTEQQARSHALQIMREGYIHRIDDLTIEWISPYAIVHVDIIGSSSLHGGYVDVDISS